MCDYHVRIPEVLNVVSVMSCYSLALVRQSDSPLLPSVSHAFVLTLSDSNRLTHSRLNQLGTLCPKTIVQVNSYWKWCTKPSYVKSTSHDLIHAYRNVCQVCKGIDGPVLILEDDADVLDADPRAFGEIDTFLQNREFDVYSFGSFGEFVEREGSHRKYGTIMGFSQAVVWSAGARRRLLNSPEGATHIDVHTLSQMSNKYTYYKPLVVQLFPTTENMGTWCIKCENQWWESIAVRAWIAFLQQGLRLDRRPDGWRTLYKINAWLKPLKVSYIVALGLLLVLVSAALIHKNRGYRKDRIYVAEHSRTTQGACDSHPSTKHSTGFVQWLVYGRIVD
jgi:hypothetical protein